MMPRSTVQRLRVFAIVALCGFFYACAHQQPANVVTEEEPPPCPATENYVVCYFTHADIQGETDDQMREVRRALMDALELTIEELRKPRYADYTLKPNQWTFAEIIGSYFLCWGRIERSGSPPEIGRLRTHENEEFYEALKAPEVAPVLKDWIEKLGSLEDVTSD